MNRLTKLRTELNNSGLDGILILSPNNRRYISGFTGTSAALLVTQTQALLFTDFRYVQQATAQAPHFEIIKHGPVMWDSVKQHIPASSKLGFEQDFVTYEQFQIFADKFTGNELVPVAGMLESLRYIKEEKELEEMQRAADLADLAFRHILDFIEPGVTEQQVALELEFSMRKHGASGASFDFIVASGSRSSLPHGVASERVINKGELVTMDFGAVVNGYCSDMTRTVMVGEPTDKQREIYQLVLEAQIAGVNAIKPGLTGKQVDAVARDIISARGYGDNFGHGLGHAVGLAIHEEPRLSPTGEKILQAGMVVTIEPGIYLPDWGGVRIEDMAVVTSNGCRVMSKSPKELIIL